jgi:hypothetical protein
MHITFWLHRSLGRSPLGIYRYRQEDNTSYNKNVIMYMMCSGLNYLQTRSKSWFLWMTNIQVPLHHVSFLTICVISSCSRNTIYCADTQPVSMEQCTKQREMIAIINKTLYLSKFICLSSDAQLNCLKNNFKIYIKIDMKTAPTCFGVFTTIKKHTIRSC